MSCPTCTHTMHGLGERWFWCPRCGTVLNADYREHTTSMTKSTEQTRAWLMSKHVMSSTAEAVLRGLVLSPDERERDASSTPPTHTHTTENEMRDRDPNHGANADWINIAQTLPAWSTVAYCTMTGSFRINIAPSAQHMGGSLELSHAAASALCSHMAAALEDISRAAISDMEHKEDPF